MYQYQYKELLITCSAVEEGQLDEAFSADGMQVDNSSQYIVVLKNTMRGSHFEVAIQLEGTPGPSMAAYQVLQHIDYSLHWPLDMLARTNLQDVRLLVSRLAELRNMVILACECGPELIKAALAGMPEWDLECGHYSIRMISDETDYSEDNDDLFS